MDEQLRQRQREFTKLALLAAFVGLITGIIAVLFRYLIQWIFDVAFAEPSELLAMAWDDRLLYALVPVVGGLIIGPLIYFLAREAKGHGVPEVMDAVIRHGGRIRFRVVGVKALASAINIGTGGSAGREGPIVHMGSAFGSNVAQSLKMTTAQTKIILGCGAAAGIAATFNTPIAGVLFAVELILMEFKTRSFVPLVIASVIATLVAPGFDAGIQHALTSEWPDDPWSSNPAFTVPQVFTLDSPWELLAYLALGIICGLLALLYTSALYKMEDLFDALRTKPWLKPAIGGLILGGVGLAFPWVHGIGYSSIGEVLNGEWDTEANTYLIGLMAVLALVKILGVSLTLGSGGSGGIFAPALFIGAMTGGAFGAILNHAFPGATGPYGAYALVAMGALVAASTRGTLTAILIIFEMTREYAIILPLLFACVIADAVASIGSPDTIYTRKLLRRGTKIVHDLEPNVMQLFTIKEVMVPREEVVTLSPGDALHKVVAVIRRTGHNGFPVLDEEGRLVGVVTHEDTRKAHNRGDLFVTAQELMTRDMVTVTPYDTGEVALRKMGDRRISHLPVVDPYDATKLMGWVSKGDVVFAYEDYHRKMEAPITDESVEAAIHEGGVPETPEEMEARLQRPSLVGRLLRMEGGTVEEPTDVEPLTEGMEVVIEREEPPRPSRVEPREVSEGEGRADREPEPAKEVRPARGPEAAKAVRPARSAEDAGWEEEPVSKGSPVDRAPPDRRTREEWEAEPDRDPGKKGKKVERVDKRSL
jgi:CIC family chloride channel protein